MINNVFQSSIHVLCSNNGSEYFSYEFNHYVTKYGIIHQSSYLYNPQKNGVAERKNCYLLKTARPIMFTNSVPNAYQGEAILTSSYLINRLPSKYLSFRTPLSVLLDSYPRYKWVLNSLSPKVYGCTVFVHKHQPSQSKFEPKALKCIFVRYSPTQQDYKCYHHSTRRFIVSCDVSFLEHQSFFHTTSLLEQRPSAEEQWDSILPLPVIQDLESPTVIESAPEPPIPTQTSVSNSRGRSRRLDSRKSSLG